MSNRRLEEDNRGGVRVHNIQIVQ